MPDTAPAEGTFRVGRVISRTFGCIGRNAGTVLALAMTVYALQYAAVYGINLATGQLRGSMNPAASIQVAAQVANLARLPFQAFLLGSFAFIAFMDTAGQRLGLPAAFRAGLRALLPITAIYLVTYLAIILGTILLVVPGILIALRWLVATQVRAIEGPGFKQAFAHSNELTRGNRGRLFGLMALYFLFSAALGGGPAYIMFARPDLIPTFGIAWPITQWLVAFIVGTISIMGLGITYAELRRSRESGLSTRLAAIFE